MARRISKEIKEEILKRIKDEGANVAQLCEEYAVSSTAVYKWLEKNTQDSSINPQLEINRLKRENQDLRAIVGQLVYDKEKQKNRSSKTNEVKSQEQI